MKFRFLLLSFLLIAIACHSPKEKSLASIRELEQQDSLFSTEHIAKLKTAYLDFATKYPDDELAPEFLFKAGQRCNVLAAHQEAIQLFQQLINTYPKHKMAEEALFLQGYIYENSLNDQQNAARIYNMFLAKYPKSELAEDAQLALQNLGKTPEEIYKSFNN